MYTSLKPGEPGSFLDWVIKEPTTTWTKLCPQCQGHGGWNLKVDAYGSGKHFQTTCDVCCGWGWISPKRECVQHTWEFVKNLGRCYNRYKCTKCGAIDDVDSGD